MPEAQQDLISDRERADVLPGDALARGAGDEQTGQAGDKDRAARREPAGDGRLYPLVELTMARLREFLREPEAVFWVFVFPVLLAFALGIAFRNTAPQKTLVAVDSSASVEGGPTATELAAALSRSSDLEAVVMSAEEAANALRTGKIALVVRPHDGGGVPASESSASNESSTSKAAANGLAAAFAYRYDPTRPESRIARLAADDTLQRALGRNDVVSASDQEAVEPGARYIDFLIPGLIGLNLMGSGMWGLGFAVVQARTRRLLKRLAATPMRRSDYLLSFMLSRLVFLVLEVAAVIVFAWLVFDVSVRGSLIDLALVSLIGALTFAGLGLLVASRPKTIEGVSGLMNLVMLPMWLLSGTFFSAARFPDFLQPLIKALPLTALNGSLRAVMSEGAPLVSSWPEIAVMLGWGVVSFALALRLFRWQ